ncbi:MAG: HPr(Ser) kinase/phosphatase [Clostridia bacterium]|nr:HPr(Ser) kinase/phosphatase [Clostridia bacterium]
MKQEQKSITLERLIQKENYEVLYLPKPAEEILIVTPNVNRPSLMFSGYTDFFDNKRIQFIGHMERSYIDSMGEEGRKKAIEILLRAQPPAVILTRNQEPFEDLMQLAEQYGVAILRTNDTTSLATSSASYFLAEQLAPIFVQHGVLVEVYGEGVLIIGDSGVGKSEVALELLSRGHRLIADDVVEIRKINKKTLSGMSPANIRHFIEVRGIGIIDAKTLFGIGAVKIRHKIHLVIKLENWDPEKAYNVLGLDEEDIEFLGVKIPFLTVPVKPGRNVAMIVEVAARNNRLKKYGYNAAEELIKKLESEAMGNV